MNKNLILAVSLSILVYLGWFSFVEKRYPQSSRPAPKTAQKPDAGKAPVPSASSVQSVNEKPDRATLEAAAVAIESPSSRALIHPLGAALVSYQYQDPVGIVELIADPRPGFLATFPELEFRRQPSKAGAQAVFTAARPDGARIKKEFLPEQGNALPRLRVTISNPTARPLESGKWAVSVGPRLGTAASELSENEKVLRAIGLTFPQGGRQGSVEVFKAGSYAPAYRWVAVDNRYFLAALVPSSQDFESVSASFPPQVTLEAKSVVLQPGSQHVWEIPYYLGAKGNTWLTRYAMGLERAIDFGFFSQLGRLLLRTLNRIHASTGNWGWSIILLTVLIQLLMSPLTYKSFKSANSLRKLAPEIAKLQQKYGKDPARLNQETLELYKRSGANPLGGCLPMLLQMPIFIALFNALRNAWELHGANWIFWVKDLSAKDPYYVLPLVMGGMMFFQNKLNPAPADPAQAKMMAFMPVIFTVMFVNFPAGLVLYWLTSSVVSSGMQLLLKRRFDRAQ